MCPEPKIAQACHALSRHGQDHFVYGHVSARVDDATIAIKSAGLAMGQVTSEHVARVGMDGVSLTPKLRLHDETIMHLAVYESRPDVAAIVHTHPIAAGTASLRGLPSGVYSQDQVLFSNSLAFFDDSMLVNSRERAVEFATCLEGNRAALLRGHGLLTVGSSIEEAVVLALLLDRALQIFLKAAAAGHLVPIPDHDVAKLRDLFERNHSGRIRDVWGAVSGERSSLDREDREGKGGHGWRSESPSGRSSAPNR